MMLWQPATPLFPYTTLFRSLTTGSTDTDGEVTATGATACTLTFGTAFTAVPSCVLTDETTAAALKAATTADRKSTRLNSSHPSISYAVFCLKKKKTE